MVDSRGIEADDHSNPDQANDHTGDVPGGQALVGHNGSREGDDQQGRPRRQDGGQRRVDASLSPRDQREGQRDAEETQHK